MAYYLQFDGANDYVLLPFARPDSMEINIRFSAPAQIDRRFISWAQDTSTAFMGIGSGNTSGTQTKLRKFGGGGSNLTGTADVFDGNIHDIKILITDNFLEIFVDGNPTPDISTAIFSNATSSYTIWSIGAVVRNSNFSVASACNMKLYSMTFSDNTVGATDFRDYNKQTLSGANDTTLPDTVGGNNGTLVNFPTDNSQWVFFDDGGGAGTQDLAITSIGSGEVFGTSSVSLGAVVLAPEGITSVEGLGVPLFSLAGVNILAEAVASSEALGAAVVGSGGVTISPTEISSLESVQEPSVDIGLVFVGAGTIPSEESLGVVDVAKLLQETFPTGIATQIVMGRPLVSGGDRILIPVESRRNWTDVSNYLKTLSFDGSLEDVILAWLRSEGYEGTWNEAWYDYWEDLGYPKAFPDKWKQWKDES